MHLSISVWYLRAPEANICLIKNLLLAEHCQPPGFLRVPSRLGGISKLTTAKSYNQIHLPSELALDADFWVPCCDRPMEHAGTHGWDDDAQPIDLLVVLDISTWSKRGFSQLGGYQ